jgi:hypothetical protein
LIATSESHARRAVSEFFAQGPIEITLTFTEPLNGPLSRASLTDAESSAVSGRALSLRRG